MAAGKGRNGGCQMTTGAFDRLLYTDCRAGMGRGAGGGFQIQAQSNGVDQAQARMAVSWLLYEAQDAWIVQHRPAKDFPLGFAHACADGYGTAQSRYLGQEATGGRQGNHLADCILTRDPDLYGPTRPAELWRSDIWRAEPWDSTDCPQLEGEPPAGPLTVGAIAAWLQEYPPRATILGRLLSVLEAPARQRVLIVATSPDEAMAWIAAATLLLPMRLALDISFKVFCANPLRAEHRIIAVPKELNSHIAPGQSDSSFIVDAENCLSDGAVVSDRARFLVTQLRNADDPYDVVDAIELAESLGLSDGASDADLVLTAWALTVPSGPLADPAALQRWLQGASPQALHEHGAAVANRILGDTPSADALRFLDAVAHQGQFAVDPVTLRGQLLRAELAEAHEGITPPAQQLPSAGLDFEARRDADSELTSAILLGSDAQADLLLRLAHRHGITLQPGPLAGRLQEFAGRWVAGHFTAADPEGWALHDEILAFADDELRARLAQNGTDDVLASLRRLHPHLTGRFVDPTDPLDTYRRVAAVAALPAMRRAAGLHALLLDITRSSVPASEIAGIQHVLVEWGAIHPAEAFEVIASLPESIEIDPDIVKIASTGLLQRAGKPDRQLLDLLAILDRRGLVPEAPPLAAICEADRNVRIFLEAARDRRIVSDNEYARNALAHLSRANPVIFRVRLRSIVAACLDCPRPDLGAALLRDIPSQRKGVLVLWAAELEGPNPVRAALWGFNCVQDPALPSRTRTQMMGVIQDLAGRLQPASRERWFLDVSRHLPPEEAQAWAVISGHERSKSRRARPFRGQG